MIYFDTLEIGFKKHKTKTIPQVFFKNDTFNGEVRLGNHEVMQSTGLKDSKGTEIYEGDIIKFKVDFPEQEFDNGIVRWADGGYWTSQIENDLEELLSEELNDLKGSEIIGNIHQNPELLKN